MGTYDSEIAMETTLNFDTIDSGVSETRQNFWNLFFRNRT